uniref:VASt domain-containing protein n=1 Tax=Globisporangium ultimum (strain ATCC 200006 / CBS 805.95 / DAOM BR144) TaxID=431595 RepID=K3WZ21_GLOUD
SVSASSNGGNGDDAAASSSSRGSSAASSPAQSRRMGEFGAAASCAEQDAAERDGVNSNSSQRHGDHLNLPLDKEFVPLAHHDDDEDADEEGDLVRDDVRDDVICMIFDLPRSTKFYQDFSCAIAGTLAMHGRMYPTNTHVCFYSNVFGRERKILMPYESISELAKTTTMVFQNAIRIATTTKDEYTFTSFWGNNRDGCYELIAKTRNRVLNDLKPAVVRGLKKTIASAATGAEDDGELHTGSENGASTSLTSPKSIASSEKDANATADATTAVYEDTDDADSDADADAQQRLRNTQSTIAEEDEQENAEQPRDVAEEDAEHARARRTSVVSDIDSVAPKDISMTQIVETMFDISVDEFMAEFFWDGAAFGMAEFGTRQGSTEMKCNPWMTLEDEATYGMTRSLQFRVPVDAPIGPKSSRVDVLQCAKKGEHNVRFIETSTRLVDIPYGDYFSVEDRWTLIPRSSSSCKLFIELKVVFSKSTFWKSKIETRAIADNKSKWLEWVDLAKQHLQQKQEQQTEKPKIAISPPTSDGSSPTLRQSNSMTEQSQHDQLTRRPSHANVLFPWILVLGLLFLVIRMQSSLTSIEQTLAITNAKMDAIETHLASLSQASSCAANTANT